MTRTVLITGAGGFVGSHMAEGFRARGDAVIALDNQFDDKTRARLQGVELLEAPMGPDILGQGRQVDLIIHAAAITTPPEAFGLTPEQHIKANVDLVQISLDLASRHGAADFVFLSSSGVFAIEDGHGVHLESTPPTATIPYAQAKRAGEQLVAAANSARLRTVSVRLGPIYGPNEARRVTRQVVSQVRRWLDLAVAHTPIVVTLPDERRDWTFAPDLPDALDQLLHMRPAISGVVHLTSGQIVSNLELARSIEALVEGASVKIEPRNEPARLPMRSDRIDLSTFHSWTDLPGGLAKVYAAEALS